MNTVIESIVEWVTQILKDWVLCNVGNMFTDVNAKVGTIASEVSQSPSSWNSSIFEIVHTLSDNVIIPIAGMIITFVLSYELINMVVGKNSTRDFDTTLLIKYVMKACLAVLILSHTFDITMAVFDVGSYMVTSAGGVISGNTSLDVQQAVTNAFETNMSGMSVGELLALGMESMLVGLCMKIMSVLITVILYGRMIEIYLYVSVAPVPFATITNQEWGNIGTGYLKGLFALAFQGFFIMICVGIYAALITDVQVGDNLHTALWTLAAYTVILCFSLFKTGALAKSILAAH